MAATQRLLTGRSSEFTDVVDAVQIIETVSVVSPVNTITFDDIDGDADEHYILIFDLLLAPDATVPVIKPNDLTTNQLISSMLLVPGGPLQFPDGTSLFLLSAGSVPVASGRVEIFAKSGKPRFFHIDTAMHQTAPDRQILWESTGEWTDTSTNLTSLVLTTNSAGNGFLVGTRVTLYKMSPHGTGGGGGGGGGSPLVAKGDIYGFSTVNARIPVGTNGQVLIADSAETMGVRWGSGLTSPLTTKGDIFVYGSDSARLPVTNSYGAMLMANPAADTGLSYTELVGDVIIVGRFLNEVDANGVGFIVDRYGTGRQSGFEWWAEGVAIWGAGLDFVSTELVLACDIQEGSGQVHDVIRIKPGSGAIKMTYGVDAIPIAAYHLHVLASALDISGRTQELRVEIPSDAINSTMPVYLVNVKSSHMILMENAAGDIWRVSAANPGSDAYVALGTSLSDGTGGSPDLFQFHDDGGMVIGAATDGTKGAGTINVSGDIYKNGLAYTNPDYALEHWATGKIEKYAGNDGAEEYNGRKTLEELEAYCRENFRLPGIDDEAMGAFARADFLLEKVEEIFTYLFDFKKEMSALRAA
jgi:hypothetical protein